MIRWLGTDIQVIDVNATDNPLVTVDVYHSNSNGLLEGEGGKCLPGSFAAWLQRLTSTILRQPSSLKSSH